MLSFHLNSQLYLIFLLKCCKNKNCLRIHFDILIGFKLILISSIKGSKEIEKGQF